MFNFFLGCITETETETQKYLLFHATETGFCVTAKNLFRSFTDLSPFSLKFVLESSLLRDHRPPRETINLKGVLLNNIVYQIRKCG